MREIGSDFWDVPLSDSPNGFFPDDTKWFLTGRMALKYIISDIEIKTAALPSWCCTSMITPFADAGIEVRFYNKTPRTDCDALYLMDYFGYTDRSSGPENYSGIVIRDVTHSLFSADYVESDYCYGSLRKWSGFAGGGFARGNWKKKHFVPPYNKEWVNLRLNAMKQKELFIKGKTDDRSYLNLFAQAEDLLEKTELCSGFPGDMEKAMYFDIEGMKTKRHRNALILRKTVGCMFEMKNTDCPLFVPVLTEHRDKLRLWMKKHNVFLPVHWDEKVLCSKELSFVCDQRYDEQDMQYVCNLYNEFWENRG